MTNHFCKLRLVISHGLVIAGVFTSGHASAQKFDFDEFFKPKDQKVDALFANVPATMRSRMTPQLRQAAMQKFGGDEKSEKGVVAALRWLKSQQNADGSWSTECKPAMTGLALLCFLGHGELPASAEFGDTVKKALAWLKTKGTKSAGRLSLSDADWKPDTSVYLHAIATLALCEYYAMTQDETFKELATTAVAHIVNGQNPRGGWDIYYAKGLRSDVSVSIWQIQALHAARLAKLPIPGIEESLKRSEPYLKSMQGGKGGFGYDRPGDDVDFTGIGVFGLHLTTRTKDKAEKEGIDYLLKNAWVDWDGRFRTSNKISPSDSPDLYRWFFETQACFFAGGPAWSKWNRMFQEEIADRQSPEGSWPALQGSAYQVKPAGAGPCYRTTLCTLMLEVFYRSAPDPSAR